MSGKAGKARGRKPKDGPHEEGFGPRDREAVLKALRRGASAAEAARLVGFDRSTLYNHRRKCAEFRAEWTLAVEEGERPTVVEPQNGRRWQLRRAPRNRFCRTRKRVFLEHFAATCDTTASAREAGVARSTVCRHRRTDPGFRQGWDEALAQGYALLEAEAVRQRLAMLERIRIAGDKDVPAMAAEFERVLYLLREHKKTLAGLPRPGPGLKTWSFEESLDALEKELKAFGIRIAKEEEEGDD